MSEDPAAAPSGSRTAAEQETEENRPQHDRESRHRTRLGHWKWVIALMGTGLTVFQLYTALFGSLTSLVQGAVHVGMSMSLVYLLYPAHRKGLNKPGVAWYDVILCGLTVWTNAHIVTNYERLTTETVIFGYEDLDVVLAVLGILLILEATRRCVGLPIVVIAVVALAYGYLGPHVPVFGHAGFSLDRLFSEAYYTSTSVFGTPIRVSSTFIFLFLFFGVVLVKTNIGQFFNDLAFGLTGRYTGGTAKAAVVASGLQGMVSGSSVANTVASGSFTIPMMKRAGFRPHFAAAAEATASTGGQLVPPIMGAAVFIMAEYTGTPYNEIVILAIIPAGLYFLGVFAGVHFEAHKTGVLGAPRDQLPHIMALAKRLYLIAPLVVIIGMLLAGRSPANAALYGIATAVLVSLLSKDTRLSPKELLGLFETGARVALPVIAACATAGIIAGTVTRTGLGGKLAGNVLDLSMGQFALVLVFTMIACLVLGMGLPTTANYVVTATVAAPILLEFGVPVIASHMFVFYFGIVADITPPVCLAAYAGSGIAGSNPMRTGMTAVKLAVPAFLVPFVFVLEPALLLQDATPATVLLHVAPAVIGIIAIAAGLSGYRAHDRMVIPRLLLITGGLLTIFPNIVLSLLGIGLLLLTVVSDRFLRHGRGDANGIGTEKT